MRVNVTDWLTMIVIAVWVVSLVVRVAVPAAATVFIGTDAAVLVIIGYWFSSNAIRRNGKSR